MSIGNVLSVAGSTTLNTTSIINCSISNLSVNGSTTLSGYVQVGTSGDTVGFFGVSPVTQFSVSISTSDTNIQNMYNALHAYGLM